MTSQFSARPHIHDGIPARPGPTGPLRVVAFHRLVGIRHCRCSCLVSPHHRHRHPLRHLAHQSPADDPDPATADAVLDAGSGRGGQNRRFGARPSAGRMANSWAVVPSRGLVGVCVLDVVCLAHPTDRDRHPGGIADVQPDAIHCVALPRRGRKCRYRVPTSPSP